MPSTEAKINIRVDKKTKEQAQQTLRDLGLDLSSGVKLFLHSVINTQSIPFDITTANGYTRAQEKKIQQEVRETLKQYIIGKDSGYASVQEMFDDLE